MRNKLGTCAIIALLLVVKTNSIQVNDNHDDQNATTQEPKKDSAFISEKLITHQTLAPEISMTEQARKVESEKNSELTTISTTTTHKIPPTLVNANFEANRDVINSEKSLKILA